MEHKSLNGVGVGIEDSSFSHSPINNNQHTTNNYYAVPNSRESNALPADYMQLRSQLDRIEQTVNFIMQYIIENR